MKLIKENGLLLFTLISIAFGSSNAAEDNRNQAIKADASIIKSQSEAYNVPLFEDIIMKDADRLQLEKQLIEAESDLRATEARLRQFPENVNIISLRSSHLEVFNEAKSQYEKHNREVVEKLDVVFINENDSNFIFENCAQNIIDIGLAPLDIQRHILGITFKSNILQYGHGKKLKLVCKSWNDWLTNDIYFRNLVKNFSVEITEKDMYDKTGSIVQKLKNNSYVVNLTFNFEGYREKQFDDSWYYNHNNLITEGLQNKPNLKIFKINGMCVVSRFLNTSDNVVDRDPKDFLNLPHLVFLKTLEEFHITETISGSSGQDTFFLDILLNKHLTPKLHTVSARRYDGTIKVFKF